MGSVDWYRRTTWSDRDRDEFNDRLKRSRSARKKAQYLRIQALYLAQSGYHISAIELLDKILTEFPERTELAQAHNQKAESLAQLGQLSSAVDEYRASLAAQRDCPGVRTMAWLDYGCLVVEHQLADLYDEISKVLDEFQDRSGMIFPAQEFRYCLIRAIIAESRNHKDVARRFAVQAIAQASKDHSGFRYHPTVGLVGNEQNKFDAKLKALAES